jgi:hypothetical protein
VLTRENKIGLVLAFLLGLADIAFLGALSEDAGDRPPVWAVVISVICGVVTLVLVVLAWRSPARPLMIAVVALRVLSAVGDIPGFTQDATVAVVSGVHLVVSVVCIVLLRNWLIQRADAERRHADAAH